nr:RNA-directed DNA polymerase, eukaryota, reverse transcriptase zinc-binding domain protein [Tanacetum cinerariifolium]
MEQELHLKREAAERAFEAQAEKDRTLMRLEELRFLATSTKDLDDDDAYWIKKQKRLIKNKMRNDLGDEEDEDEFQRGAKNDGLIVKNQAHLPKVHTLHSTSYNRSYVAIVLKELPQKQVEQSFNDKPVMVIREECFTDKNLDFTLVAKVKNFESIPNLRVTRKEEGFKNLTIRHLGELVNFNKQGAALFNYFIQSTCLIDIALGGYSFTWVLKDERKMSKLDRFLVSEGILCQFSGLLGSILSKHLSDHRLIMLKETSTDYGHITYTNDMSCLKKKLQLLKHKIKSWVHQNRVLDNAKRKDVVKNLESIDKQINQLGGLKDLLTSRRDLWKKLTDIDVNNGKDLAQKAKVKWAIEGDENSKFFHGIVNKKGKKGSFSKRCNPSFITLIPKLNDAKVVKDYRPISLIGCQYKIVGKILANRLSMVMDKLISKEQPAFIRDRQILDGPMILSKVIQWWNRKRKKSMIFKVDFKKAFDLVRWDFLDMILQKFGFGRFFKGIKVGGQESVNISHLFYTDDAVFIGEWKEENFHNVVYILHCFYLAFGLHIIHKCSLMGVGGVNFDEVCIRASVIGCEAAKPPFKYLRVLVGNNMSRIHNWDVVINKVLSMLSKWKAKTLSIGGRYTLTKSVLSALPTNYFSLFKVSIGVLNRLETIHSKFFRGMYSFYAMNHSLLFKWIWRFKTNPDALWALIIKAIHGVDLLSCISKRVRNGNKTSFWLEKWIECGVLKEKFPRLFAFEINKQATVFDKLQVGVLSSFRRDPRGGAECTQMEEMLSLINSVEFSAEPGIWNWSLSSDGIFSVSSARIHVDEGLCIMEGPHNRWSKLVPIKVNILMWMIRLNKLPTRHNMSLRGLDIPYISCPVCLVGVETYDHLFFSCSTTSYIITRILVWWELPFIELSSFLDWQSWFDGLKLKHELKAFIEATFFVSWWVILSF